MSFRILKMAYFYFMLASIFLITHFYILPDISINANMVYYLTASLAFIFAAIGGYYFGITGGIFKAIEDRMGKRKEEV